MFSPHSDLLHDKDCLNRFLPWLIAFMVFLMILAMAGMLLLNAITARWDRGINGTLTVQIMPKENPEKNAERLQQVLTILARMPEVASYEALNDDQLMVLLEPWLGITAGAHDLPLPGLVDVELKPDADLDVPAFAKRLAARVPGTSIDDHRVWLERLVILIETAQGLAALVVVFIVLATIGTVVFTTRTGLVIHREAIEVLHLIGAQDSYVARQFAGLLQDGVDQVGGGVFKPGQGGDIAEPRQFAQHEPHIVQRRLVGGHGVGFSPACVCSNPPAGAFRRGTE